MSLLNTTLKDDVHASRLKIDAVEVCIYILNCLLVIRSNSLYYFIPVVEPNEEVEDDG